MYHNDIDIRIYTFVFVCISLLAAVFSIYTAILQICRAQLIALHGIGVSSSSSLVMPGFMKAKRQFRLIGANDVRMLQKTYRRAAGTNDEDKRIPKIYNHGENGTGESVWRFWMWSQLKTCAGRM
jgi:hypothetical protein